MVCSKKMKLARVEHYRFIIKTYLHAKKETTTSFKTTFSICKNAKQDLISQLIKKQYKAQGSEKVPCKSNATSTVKPQPEFLRKA